MAFGYSSQVVIAEVIDIGGAAATAGGASSVSGTTTGRSVVLRGSALPFMGAEWGFEQTMTTTWYPGNAAEATQQVLGPRELPSTWEGEWKRTLLGRTPVLYLDDQGDEQRLVEPHLVRQVLEDIGRRGHRLRVTWAVSGTTQTGPTSDFHTIHNEDVKITREGRIKSFRTPIDRHTDIRWTIEFHWAGRGTKGQKAVSVREDTDASTIANGISSSIGAMSAAVDDAIVKKTNTLVPRSATRLTLGQLESFAAFPSTLVNRTLRSLQFIESQFKRAGEVALRAARQPAEILNAVSNFAVNTRAQANNFTDAAGRVPVELKSSKTRADSVLNAGKFFDKGEQAAQQVARKAQEVLGKILLPISTVGNQGLVRGNSGTQAARPGDLIAVYVTREGDTPTSISIKFYGTADKAADLLKANKLAPYTPAFRKGQILAVPSADAIARRKRG